MDPITAAIGFITLALKFANSEQAKEIVDGGKSLITTLMNHGLVTKAQQDEAHAHVDAVCEAFLAGQEPPAWKVEADPVTATKPPIVPTMAEPNPPVISK